MHMRAYTNGRQDGLEEGKRMCEELAASLEDCLTVIGLANWEGCDEATAARSVLSKYKAWK